MAVAFGSAGTYLAYGNRFNATLVAPAGIADGDLLIAYLFTGVSSTPDNYIIPDPPAGWTELAGSPTKSRDSSGFNGAFQIYYKIASGESGNYTFLHLTASSCGLIIRYTGVDTASPLSPTPTANTGGADIATALGFTTTVDNTFVIFTEHDWADNTDNMAVPAGATPTFTERLDDVLIYIADGTLATAGATGNKSHSCNNTTSSGNSKWGAYLIGLKPVTAVALTLGDKVLDAGLGYISSNANRIYVCSQQPLNYTQATTTYALGYKDFGVGGVAGAPGVGRKVTTNAVVGGTITGTGTVTCWAIVDTVNSLLLATGDMTGGIAANPSKSWSLGPIAIVLDGTP